MRTFPRESGLYLMALVLGLAVRLVGLGSLPLTDQEAQWALQSLGVANGTHRVLGSQPAYVLLTSALFFTFGGATNFLARLLPALVGSGLILVPRLFKDRLKPRPAVILAFMLALEPGLVALSRQAGSSIMTLTFLLATWGLWNRKSFRSAGIFAGLTLLSGSALWVALLAFAITWMLLRPFESPAEMAPHEKTAPRQWGQILTAFWFALGTMLFAGTLFLMVPSGFSAWLSGLPEYIAGWSVVSDISAGLLVFSLVAYQPLGLVLALVAVVRGWIQGSQRIRRLSLWLLVTLLLALFFPSRQITDLVWMLIPLWALASLELARSLNIHRHERMEVLGVAALTVLITIFMWLDFLALLRSAGATDQVMLRTWLLFGSLLLLVVSLLLVAAGWSVRVARFGAAWGLVAALGVYSFAVMLGAAGLRRMPEAVDMWRPGGTLPQADLVLTTVQQMSGWSKKDINAQPVTIVGIDSPALAWLLRERELEMEDLLEPLAAQPIIITVEQDSSTLAAAYRGQSLVWRRTPLWIQSTARDWLSWLPFHQVAQQTEKLIVWVRSDLFLDLAVPKP